MADNDVTQTTLNGDPDPTIDDGEEAESKVVHTFGCVIKVLNVLTGNSADETTCGGDGEGGEKVA